MNCESSWPGACLVLDVRVFGMVQEPAVHLDSKPDQVKAGRMLVRPASRYGWISTPPALNPSGQKERTCADARSTPALRGLLHKMPPDVAPGDDKDADQGKGT